MKALVVDDDIVSRMALCELLGSYEVFDLVEAADGQQAWAQMEAGLRPAIVFCDVRMPRMSGIDLLQRMKEQPALAEVPFALVSSASDRDTVLQAVRLGAVGYILKPLHAAEARAHIDKIFSITIDKLSEHPQATMRRLNIGIDRLAGYLGAFATQLAAARSALAGLQDEGGAGAAPGRLDLVHTGCMTLGLWRVAARVDLLRQDPLLPAAQALGAIDLASDAVERQARRLRTLMAPASAAAAQRQGAAS